MSWPKYPYPGAAEELDRHAQAPETDAGTFTLAVDVWRDGAHLWRSYALEDAETLDDWADRELPEGTARNDDAGYWRAPGVLNIGLYPIPRPEAMRPVASMGALRDILATVFAVGQLPLYPPQGLDQVPTENSIFTRLYRADRPYLTLRLFDQVTQCSVRAVIGRREEVETVQEPPRQFVVRLERRETRAGATEVTLTESQATISSTPQANRLIRAAKAALGIEAWPAQRQGKALLWHLTGAPYRVTISPT